MIGPLSYLNVEADNDDQARAKFAVMLDHRGGGLYQRWRDSGMRVAEFKRGLLTREETKSGNHQRLHSGNHGADRGITQAAYRQH
jgi:hypothetical protein